MGLLAATVAVAQPVASPAPFTVDALFKLERASGVAISPAGDQVAVVSERQSTKAYWAKESTLWLVSTKGGKPRRAVEEPGEVSQTRPLWSPNGKMLAYSAQTEKETKLRIIGFGARQTVSTLTPCSQNESIGTLAWSPDARQMAVVCESPLWSEQPEKPPTIIVASQSTLYRNASKPIYERRVVLFDIASARGKEIAKGSTFMSDDGALTWKSPRTLWIMATRDGDLAGLRFLSGRIAHRYDVAAGRIVATSAEMPVAHMPVLTSDESSFVAPVGGSVGGIGDVSDWRATWRLIPLTMRRFGLDGKPMPLAHQTPLEIFVGDEVKQAVAPARDKRAGGSYYLQWVDQASGRIKALSPATGEWRDLTPAGMHVSRFSVSADGTGMALIQGNVNQPNEAYFLDLKQPSARPVRLTHFEDDTRASYAVASVEQLQFRSKDDRFTISGWLLKPANYEKGKRYPLILDVHGGPGAAFLNSFDTVHFAGGHQVPPELFAARGYMVLMVNPRGDPTYGRAHQEALLEGLPPATLNDLFAGVDEAIRLGYADPDKLGIAGGSYGGWVTTFAVSVTDRFKAASANDAVIDFNIGGAVSYRGDRLTNYWLYAGLFQGHLFDKAFPTVNPMTVNTPIQLRFGLKELETPMPSQFVTSGLPYFAYLHAHCKPVEMILHPEDGHGIFDWTTLRDYIQRDLAWFDYFIKGEGDNPLPQRSCPKL
jgi:acylaminoacyl-peptidase